MTVSPHTILETDRFLLRRITHKDREDMFELDSDPDVHKYLGGNPLTHIEQIDGIIDNIHEQYRKNGWGRLAIIDKKDGAFIGWTGLKWETEIRSFPYYDIGYRLKKKYWGQGIATETSIACIRYGFEKKQLDRICGAAEARHAVSNHILTKIGLNFQESFEFEGEVCRFYGVNRNDWLNLP